MNSRTLDLIVGILALVGSIFIYSVSRGFPERAALMPSLISGIMAAASIALIIKAYRQARGSGSAFANVSWNTLGITVAAWFCLIFLSAYVNFFVLVTLFLFFIALLLNGKPKSTGEIIRFVAFSLGISLGLWVLFSLVLNISFPVEGLFVD